MRPRRYRKPGFGGFWQRVVIAALCVIIVLLCALLFDARGRMGGYTSRNNAFSLQNCGELVTQVGYFTNVQEIRNSRIVFGVQIPFTEKYAVYAYDGAVRAGVDFTRSDVKVDEGAKAVTVTLPQPEIIGGITVDYDSLRVYSEYDNLFNALKVEDYNAGQRAMEAEIRKIADEQGIFQAARENAETLVRAFLLGDGGFAGYTVEFAWEEEAYEASEGG